MALLRPRDILSEISPGSMSMHERPEEKTFSGPMRSPSVCSSYNVGRVANLRSSECVCVCACEWLCVCPLRGI